MLQMVVLEAQKKVPSPEHPAYLGYYEQACVIVPQTRETEGDGGATGGGAGGVKEDTWP